MLGPDNSQGERGGEGEGVRVNVKNVKGKHVTGTESKQPPPVSRNRKGGQTAERSISQWALTGPCLSMPARRAHRNARVSFPAHDGASSGTLCLLSVSKIRRMC